MFLFKHLKLNRFCISAFEILFLSLGVCFAFSSQADTRSKIRARRIVIENFGRDNSHLSPEGEALLRIINQVDITPAEIPFFHAVSQQHFLLTHEKRRGRHFPISDRPSYADDLRSLFWLYDSLTTRHQRDVFLLEISSENVTNGRYDLSWIEKQGRFLREWKDDSEFQFPVLSQARQTFKKDPHWHRYFEGRIDLIDNPFTMRALLHIMRVVVPPLDLNSEADLNGVLPLGVDFTAAFHVNSREELHAFIQAETMTDILHGNSKRLFYHRIAAEHLLPTVHDLTAEQQELLMRLYDLVFPYASFLVHGETERYKDISLFASGLRQILEVYPNLPTWQHGELLLAKAFERTWFSLHMNHGWIHQVPRLPLSEVRRLLAEAPPKSLLQHAVHQCGKFLSGLRKRPTGLR